MEPQKIYPESNDTSDPSVQPKAVPTADTSPPEPGFAGSAVSSPLPPANPAPPAQVVEPSAQADPGSAPLPGPVTMSAAPLPLAPHPHKRGKKGLIIGVIVAALILVLGGSAAATFYYLSNKPENVLKQALAASLNMKEIKSGEFSGEVSVEDSKSGVNAGVRFQGESDGQTGAVQLSGEADLLVTKLDFEMRSLDSKSFYFKVGGLDGLTQLMTSNGLSFFTTFLDALDNKWIEINESMIKQFGGGYEGGVLSEADAEKLRQAYLDHPFLVVKKVLKDEVIKGENHYHYQVAIDPAQFKGFMTAVSEAKIPSLKMDKQVLDEVKKGIDQAKFEKYPFELWISKADKRINRISMQFEEEGTTFSMKLNVDSYNKPVKVEKPADAKSILDLYNDFLGDSFLNNPEQPLLPLPADLQGVEL